MGKYSGRKFTKDNCKYTILTKCFKNLWENAKSLSFWRTIRHNYNCKNNNQNHDYYQSLEQDVYWFMAGLSACNIVNTLIWKIDSKSYLGAYCILFSEKNRTISLLVQTKTLSKAVLLDYWLGLSLFFYVFTIPVY